ncbi:MAG: DUF3368 domain-containing protein [Xanthomonadales bacterium]|nr:DUF3368 domain-containing protein [Xanthomonadales bacterium]
MPPPLLISDSNILIDLDCCGLLPKVFKLPFQIAVPDVLYLEELSEKHAELPALGLKVLQFGPNVTSDIMRMRRQYPASGFLDLTALAVARSLGADLLTGDKQLRKIAEAEQQRVRGTIWVMTALVEHKVLSRRHAVDALEVMKSSGRRLPWKKARRAIEEAR